MSFKESHIFPFFCTLLSVMFSRLSSKGPFWTERSWGTPRCFGSHCESNLCPRFDFFIFPSLCVKKVTGRELCLICIERLQVPQVHLTGHWLLCSHSVSILLTGSHGWEGSCWTCGSNRHAWTTRSCRPSWSNGREGRACKKNLSSHIWSRHLTRKLESI